MELIVGGKRKRVRHAGSVSSLLKNLGILRDEVIVKVNGRLVPETKEVSGKDSVEIIRIATSG